MFKTEYAEDGAKLHPPPQDRVKLARVCFLLQQIEEIFLLWKLGSRKKNHFFALWWAVFDIFKTDHGRTMNQQG